MPGMQTEPAHRALIARNRGRQRELYGCALGDRVRRLTGTLGITQARLARAIGLSPAMLSQLVSARRVKIGDPAVLARLLLLDQRCAESAAPPRPDAVEALLAEVARARWQWRPPRPISPSPGRPAPAVEALREVAAPARLAAAAAALGPAFPELAAVLRQAARGGGAAGAVPGPAARACADRPW
jgi:transcriptional regulator with XRE-family HTH domain